jgi:hypothetical protein
MTSRPPAKVMTIARWFEASGRAAAVGGILVWLWTIEWRYAAMGLALVLLALLAAALSTGA